MTRRGVVGAGVLAALLAAGWPAIGVGQEVDRERGDSVGQLPGDSTEVGTGAMAADTLLTAADSARMRVLERLQNLSRPILSDSVRAERDSARVLEVRERTQGAGRGGGQAQVAGADSIMNLLLALPGYLPARYDSDRADFRAADRRLVLTGTEDSNARFQRDGVELSADSTITYDEASRRILATGLSTLTPPDGDPVTSRSLVYDLDEARGSATGARSQYTQGAQWIVQGDLASVSQGNVFGTSTTFTSCDHENPHSYFKTNRIKILTGNILVARPVVLYFEDVPVAWLPFMAQSLGSGRSSGLLAPRFSVNDIVRSSQGYSRRISNMGFYWAMSEYTDAQLSMDWFSGRYIAGTGGFRYRYAPKFLQGDINVRQYWREGGGEELAFDTQHSWEVNERTRLQLSARYASSADFVRENSFDPREVTQSINSQGGLNRRFDWGNLSVNGDRQQYLSDDRVITTFPRANLSLSPVTLFGAPASRARWFNNMTWSGSTSFSRRAEDRADQLEEFVLNQADRLNNEASASHTLNLGFLSISQNARFAEGILQGVPESFFPDVTLPDDFEASLLDLPRRELGGSEVTWSSSINYQQRLVGSTSITPRLSLSGRSIRSDTVPEAMSLVSAPSRVAFGADLKTDMYGFFPGFGRYDAIRHKLSPTFGYSYSPTTTPTELQERVFGAREIQPRNQLTIGVTQTFEARVRPREEGDAGEGGTSEGGTSEGGAAANGGAMEADSGAGVGNGQASARGNEPRRVPRSEVVNLLSLRTSAVTYDFVEADSVGEWAAGFSTTRLSNQIGSDFLRGLSVSMEHDLFREDRSDGAPPGSGRVLAPHLSSLNFSFSLNSRSLLSRGVSRLLGLGDGQEDGETQQPEDDEEVDEYEDDPFEPRDGMDESQVVPGMGRERRTDDRTSRQSGGGQVGQWNANLSYSLRRPRSDGALSSFGSGERAQMLQGTLSFTPTEHWDVNWRTSYDLETQSFSDHMVRLTRDLHEWEAHFDFRQTATGNWSFRFEVSLVANRDLKFDFEQRNPEAGRRRF
ncbi:MAG: putative LPS assembly protein LptD [Gemmatimonadota bacterium]